MNLHTVFILAQNDAQLRSSLFWADWFRRCRLVTFLRNIRAYACATSPIDFDENLISTVDIRLPSPPPNVGRPDFV